MGKISDLTFLSCHILIIQLQFTPLLIMVLIS